MRAAEPDGRHYWLELKRAKAPLSEAQERFRQELVDRTVVHGIARSFDVRGGVPVDVRRPAGRQSAVRPCFQATAMDTIRTTSRVIPTIIAIISAIR